MFKLDDPRVESFLQDWFILGEHQFGRYRNQCHTTLEGYKKFIRECQDKEIPAFTSVQPKLKIVNVFFEFDIKEEFDEYSYDMEGLDIPWVECKIIASRIKEMGAEPLIFFSGRRGYHVYASLGNLTFEPEAEDRARRFYKAVLYGILKNEEDFPHFDKLPTHINALARMPFSYHQKTRLQVIPLTLDREPYIPDVLDFRENSVPKKWINELLTKHVHSKEPQPQRFDPKTFESWKIRDCIKAAILLSPSHNARLAFLVDALYAGLTDEDIHSFMGIFPDYKYRYTQYQINYSKKKINRKTNPLKPWGCGTLKEHGLCDESCDKSKIFSWGNAIKSSKKE